MRKLTPILLLAILVLALVLPVRADSAATGLDMTAAVSTDGSVTVTVLLTAHLDLPDSDLAFPVPAGAKNVTLNGNGVKTSRSGDTQLVSLAGLTGDSGDFSATIGYTLPSQVAYRSDGKAQLTLPLLSGFNLPIQSGTFRVSLPSAFTAKPVFSSGYYQTGIDGSLKISSAVGSVTATITGTLRDRETLTMTVEAPTELFPEVDPTAVHPEKIFSPMLMICAGLALLYYIFFLRFPLLFPERTADPPEGITAGELPTALTCRGADLTLMVLSWAQLGYILIYLEEDGRVTLHKRMGMPPPLHSSTVLPTAPHPALRATLCKQERAFLCPGSLYVDFCRSDIESRRIGACRRPYKRNQVPASRGSALPQSRFSA